MKVAFLVEASQPNGANLRMALGFEIPLVLISAVAALLRLF